MPVRPPPPAPTVPMARPLEWPPPKPPISAVPYLPGLDGMRAIAVAAVMVYHANSSWLPGGFLGVEVFFVISGYLITLLLIGEHERTGEVKLGQFWLRRARRLLPALFVLLIGVTVYTTLFRDDALGQLRGDVVAALTYVTNWYQIWVGQGYTASGDFAPLRHLWSLAVEEQFYLVWPLVMVGLMRLGRRRLPDLSRYLFLAAIGVTVLMAVLYYDGPDRHSRGHAGRLLDDRRAPHLEDRHALPEHDHPRRWAAAGRCLRHGLAACGDHARTDPAQGPAARRARPRRSRRARRAVLVHLPDRPQRRRSVAVPRGLLPLRPGHPGDDRRRDPPAGDGRASCSATWCCCGSAPAPTVCTSTTGRSSRASGGWPATP